MVIKLKNEEYFGGNGSRWMGTKITEEKSANIIKQVNKIIILKEKKKRRAR